jgi:LPS-assembly lipoprotein
MSSCDQTVGKVMRRGLLVLTVAAALSACGFAPVHDPETGNSQLANRVRFADPQDRNDFDFIAQMQDRLGPAARDDFQLSYEITTASDALAITSAQEINRYNVTGSVEYKLVDAAGDTVAQGTARSFTSYSAAGTTVATLAGERDAEKRLMTILADRVLTQLMATRMGPQ